MGTGNASVRAKPLDRLGKLWPGSCQTEHTWNPRGEIGEAVAEVLNEGMATGDDAGAARLLEPTHRIQSLLQMPVVALDAVVEILRCPMLNPG